MATFQTLDDKTALLLKQSFSGIDASETDLVKVSSAMFKDAQVCLPRNSTDPS